MSVSIPPSYTKSLRLINILTIKVKMMQNSVSNRSEYNTRHRDENQPTE